MPVPIGSLRAPSWTLQAPIWTLRALNPERHFKSHFDATGLHFGGRGRHFGGAGCHFGAQLLIFEFILLQGVLFLASVEGPCAFEPMKTNVFSI